MAERRMLWKRVSTSRKVNSLSLKAALLWTWCVPYFDSEGCLEVEPDDLKWKVLPRREDINEDEIEDLVDEIIEAGLWNDLEIESGTRAVQDPKFQEMQTIVKEREAPSKFLTDQSRTEKKKLGKGGWRGSGWSKIQYQIRQRDKVCRLCGKTPEQNNRALQVHHIKQFEDFNGDYGKANDSDNLIALCQACHLKIRNDPSLINQCGLNEYSLTTHPERKLK